MPKVSVVMPAYNAEKYIREAIDSILNQTFTDFEFIIINDGSKDKTKDIILSYSDSRIVYLENEKNSGIVVTLNKGLDTAKGEFIARMDADDIAIKNRLERQIAVMDHDSSIGVLGTGIRIFGENEETRETRSTTNPDKLKAELIFSSCVCHPTVMMRKRILDDYNISYQEGYHGAEDYKMWWQIASVSKIQTLPDILHCYRVHPDQITQVRDKKYIDLLSRMLDERLETMKINLSHKEYDSFLMYCLGDYALFKAPSMYSFIDALYKLLRANDEIKMFNRYYLREVFSLAIEYSLNNSDIIQRDRKECRRYARDKDIYPLILRIKLFAHKIIG